MNKPERSCVVCKNIIEKKDLLRIVKNKDGEISLDPTGRKNGRGAYLCKNIECALKLKKSKGLDRSFKMNVSSKVYEEILQEVSEIREGENG